MFDTKKLLEALASTAPAAPQPAAPAPAPSAPAAAPAAPAAAPAPSAPVLGAGTLLSDFIGYVAKDAPPPPPPASEGDQPSEDVKAATPRPPASPDLTDHLISKAQEYLRSPQGNAAVNALVLGLAKFAVQSNAGKKLATTAKTGGLALIGELTQRAKRLQVPATGAAPQASAATPGASTETVDGNGLLILRTMIAAAAADGEIDAEERRRIAEGMKQAGLGPELTRFLESEFTRPATIPMLVAGVKSPEVAAQIYTAARITIEPDKTAERIFLAELAGSLGLDPKLVASIDAAAAGA
jgi:uncharacterized membrane protein YebE (DUF533 family)